MAKKKGLPKKFKFVGDYRIFAELKTTCYVKGQDMVKIEKTLNAILKKLRRSKS